MKPVLLAMAFLLITACSTAPKRLACDRHLVPINPPAKTSTLSESSP